MNKVKITKEMIVNGKNIIVLEGAPTHKIELFKTKLDDLIKSDKPGNIIYNGKIEIIPLKEEKK